MIWQAIKTLYHRLGSPKWFYYITGRWLPWMMVASLVLLATGLVWGLFIAPPDYQQGNSFRIIYVHVPAAFLAQSIYVMMAISGVVLLVWKIRMTDIIAASLVPIGASMTFLSLLTGAVWGVPTWGTWWMWDARLTSMLILFFLYLGMMALRLAIRSPDIAARACALMAIVGVINIPIIKYSVDWWYTLHQPATFKIIGGASASMPASMALPLLVMILGFYCFLGWVLILQARALILKRESQASWVKDLIKGERHGI